MNLVTQQSATLGTTSPSPDETIDLLFEFYFACRSLLPEPPDDEPPPWQDDQWRDGIRFLLGQGVRSEIMNVLEVRFCGSEYTRVMAKLQRDFGTDALVEAGLMRAGERGKPYGTFMGYARQRVGFYVFYHMHDGRFVQLRVRPALDEAGIESARVPRFLATSPKAPGFYNHRMPEGSARVVLVEGEIAVLTALTHYMVSDQEIWVPVATPTWKMLSPAWCRELAGKQVAVLVDEWAAGEVDGILRKFKQAKLPEPRVLEIPCGIGLREFLAANDLAA